MSSNEKFIALVLVLVAFGAKPTTTQPANPACPAPAPAVSGLTAEQQQALELVEALTKK